MTDTRTDIQKRLANMNNLQEIYKYDYRCIFCNGRLKECEDKGDKYLACESCHRVYDKKMFLKKYSSW